jgi:hypothetical protein
MTTLNTNALCTFDDVSNFKDNYEHTSENDDLIYNLINEKSMQIIKYLGYDTTLKSATYTEYYDGKGINKLFPRVYPIISVTLIYEDSDWGWELDTLIDSTQYRIVDSKYIVRKDTVFANYEQNVKIIYVAGYATVPEDIKLVCIKEVVRDFNRRYDFDVSAKTADDGSITYVEKGLLVSSKEILAPYVLTGIS